MEDFVEMFYLNVVFLVSTVAISRQTEVSNTSHAELTLLHHSGGLEPGDNHPLYINKFHNAKSS